MSRAVILKDNNESVLIDDILHRDPYVCKRVKLTLEVIDYLVV